MSKVELFADDEMYAFDGELLSTSSSHRDSHTHPEHEPSQGRCSACRWFEVWIYRATDDAGETEYYIDTRGQSIIPGERCRTRVERTPSAQWVVECLAQRRDGETFIPTVSRRALAEAAAKDSAIDDAFINRAIT